MTTLDWIIVGFIALLALNGLRQGFVVGLLQLGGFAGGAYLGSRLGPPLLSDGARSPYAPLFALGGAVLVGSLLAAGLQVAGLALRRAMILPGFRLADGGLGAVLGAALALGIAWVAGAAALQMPGVDLRADVQRSTILSHLYRELPPSGSLLNALARFDPLPQVRLPLAELPAPPDGIGTLAGPVAAVADGVVRVRGNACGLAVEGSGWVAADGVVVTNAHVVAGQHDTTVQTRGGGAQRDARVVLFDATQDIAILRVAGLSGAGPLPRSDDPPAGLAAAVLGFPRNGSFTARPARLGATRTVITENAYGRGPVRRLVVAFRGRVEPGNSGGPLVDEAGRVVGTVFASTVGDGARGGYAVPNAVVGPLLARVGSAEVSAGACAR